MEKIVDSHFHIWDLSLRATYPKTDASFDWPNSSSPVIHRNIQATEAEEEMVKSGVEAAVFVQCLNSCPGEVAWVASLAQKHKFIKGILGGLDLTQDGDTLRAQIRTHGNLLVGVRHMIDLEEQDWLLREDVAQGLSLLEDEGKVFDCLVKPSTLKHVATIARRFPKLKLVVGSMAKPNMSLGQEWDGLQTWRDDMAAAASCPNVFCKLSGLVPQPNGSVETFKPYIDLCLSLFGPDRCMFGSSWPVCKVAGAEHKQVVDLLKELVTHLSKEESEKIFYSNAIKCYNLKI